MTGPRARARRPLAWLALPVRIPLAALACLELACVGLFHLVVRPRYRIEGQCQHNGVCCHHLLIAEPAWMTWPGLGALARLWLGAIHRLRPTPNLVELPGGGLARIHTCDALGDDGRCREHWLRPLACRRYPRPGYFVAPALHRGCGYRVVDRATGEVVAPDAPLAPGEVAARYHRDALIARWRGAACSLSRRGGDRET